MPAGDFEISLPEIEVDGKVAELDASSKTATEEKETTSQSGAVRPGCPGRHEPQIVCVSNRRDILSFIPETLCDKEGMICQNCPGRF